MQSTARPPSAPEVGTEGSKGDTECTSQRVGKNRRRVVFTHALRGTLCTPCYPPDERDMHMHVNFGVIRVSSNTRQRLLTCV
jgi:hypothetical protein